MQEGERVGAVLSGKDGVVQFLGWGVYEGRGIPSGAVGPLGEELARIGVPNPRIKLDSGKVVWGCECWWGPEAKVKERLEAWKSQGWTIEDVDIEAIREEQRATEPKEGGSDGE